MNTYRCQCGREREQPGGVDPRFPYTIAYCATCKKQRLWHLVKTPDEPSPPSVKTPPPSVRTPMPPDVRSASDAIEVFTTPDENSMAAAARAVESGSAAAMRRAILAALYRNERVWSCEEFDVRLAWKHQSTSAQLNGLWKAGLVVRTGRRRNRAGNPEYIYGLADWLRDVWDGNVANLRLALERGPFGPSETGA